MFERLRGVSGSLFNNFGLLLLGLLLIDVVLTVILLKIPQVLNLIPGPFGRESVANVDIVNKLSDISSLLERAEARYA